MSSSRTQSFGLTNDDRAVLEAADKFARKEFQALSRRMDDEEWWPPEIFAKIGAAGFMGATVSPEYGGAGMDLFSSGLICQAFARWNPAIALSWAAHDNLCVNNIFRNANEVQRRQYLPGLCDGSKIGALGLTEPGAGSDALGSMRSTARSPMCCWSTPRPRRSWVPRVSRPSSSRRTSPASRWRKSW